MFLAKYKVMLGSDCKMIYNAKDYHRKRLKILEQEKYVKRVNTYYIKLDDKGTRLVKDFGYDYSFLCRKKDYMDRVNEVARIAALTINSDIEFIASWNLKDKGIFTQIARKYIGKLKYQGKERITYYISKDKPISYIRQIENDIQKNVNYKNIIVFMENMKILNNNHYFAFGKESIIIVKPSSQNLTNMKMFEEIDIYQIIKKIYKDKEILLSNWPKADYMTEDRNYIIIMPFIDTERLYKLKLFLKNNQKIDRGINIITLKENKEKIDEILTNKVNTIELDSWLGGINGEWEKEKD